MSNKIKGKIKVKKIRYFKNDWGIALVAPIEIEQGKPTLDDYGTFVIKGIMLNPKEDEDYQIVADEVNDPKWGVQYNIISFTTNAHVDEGDEGSKRKYLEHVFTPSQVEALYNALQDPFTALKNNDTNALVQVRGCGLKNARKWVEKFNANYYLSRLYIELEGYDLTPTMMKRLLDYYKSPELVVKRIKENPYLLTEIGGIGFKTADNIAMKNGMPQWDERRIGAYITYSLDRHGREGNSFIYSDELMDGLVEQFGSDIPDLAVASTIHGVIKDKLWWSGDKTEIGLKRYYNLEENICNEIKRISEAPIKSECKNIDDRLDLIEKCQGWQFTDQQRLGIKTANEHNLVIVNGASGCVDCDTEFFTGERWKRIADYQKGDKVLQYNSDGTTELVEPLAYIKQPSKELYHFETKYGLSQTLSYDHNVVYITSKGHLNKIPMHEVMRRNEESRKGFNGKFITTFSYEDKGLPLFDDEIRLMVAIFADGHFEKFALRKGKKGYRRVRVNLKKERKKQRLEMLLGKLQISYKKKESTVNGYHVYDFYAPFIGKHYIKDWYHCTECQRKIIADEVMKWDGNYSENNRYSTNNKDDADFIQFVFASLGYRATISTHNRVNKPYSTNGKEYIRKSIEYSVSYTSRTLVSMVRAYDEPKTPIVAVKPTDEMEYCFTVPSGMLVLRKDDKIFISGNCGKSSIAGAIIELFGQSSSAACCLSGKAAARLGEVIGTPGSTIHRLLGFNPETKDFIHNRENPLPQDLIIVDEISMIGGSLFYKLLQAVQSGAKVIMLGDTGQLEAIGECNVANDVINSGVVPVVTLDKIHRQAAKSAIITESMKIRRGTQIIDKDYAGVQILGERQDMVLDCYSDKANTAYKTLEYFKSELAEYNGDVLKVQMIVPMRSRGEISVWNLNKLAQEYCNPDSGQSSVSVKYLGRGDGVLRVGDKIIATQNNYKDCNMYDESKSEIETVPIFNGYIGIIEEIEPDSYMIIDFLNVGRVLVPCGLFNTIELAYAITVHKFQGAQTESVIVALDYSAYSLLSKELVYTAITRAQKKCILVAQNTALRFAIDITRTSNKKTHLQRLLKGEYENKELIF